MTFNAEFLWDGQPPGKGSVDFPRKNAQTEAEEDMASGVIVLAEQGPVESIKVVRD